MSFVVPKHSKLLLSAARRFNCLLIRRFEQASWLATWAARVLLRGRPIIWSGIGRMVMRIDSPGMEMPGEARQAAPVSLFRRLVVALDERAPAQGAFVHSREWAQRLHVPMCQIHSSDLGCNDLLVFGHSLP